MDGMAQMMAVLKEIEQHTSRLARDAKLGNATGSRAMTEIGETVLPLLRDFARIVATEVHGLSEYIHEEVEPLLLEAAGAADSMLRPEDAELITARLLGYRTLLEGAKDRTMGDEKAAVEAELGEVDTALARVAEITANEDDDPDAGDDDPDADDPDDDEPEESAAPAGTPKQ